MTGFMLYLLRGVARCLLDSAIAVVLLLTCWLWIPAYVLFNAYDRYRDQQRKELRSMTTRGVYTGELAHLKGATALLRYPPEESHVLAQFDNASLTRSGNPIPQVLDFEPHARFPTLQDAPAPPADALGFGWHVFRRNEFDIQQ